MLTVQNGYTVVAVSYQVGLRGPCHPAARAGSILEDQVPGVQSLAQRASLFSMDLMLFRKLLP